MAIEPGQSAPDFTLSSTTKRIEFVLKASSIATAGVGVSGSDGFSGVDLQASHNNKLAKMAVFAVFFAKFSALFGLIISCGKGLQSIIRTDCE